ncbi:MAG TPA: hypothetical protein VFQ35_04650 [Polyangiaceae bacterium]|nr:hypothetical protein [Polyangiaceae bacterium]
MRFSGEEFGLVDTTFERKVAEMEPAHPPLSVVDSQPKKGPWTGNNNLGYRLKFAPDADNRQTILKLPEWGFPEVWTVSLALSGFPGGLFDGFGVTGHLEFGVGGATENIAVDWANGTQVSLAMNALNVIAEFSNLDVTEEGQGLELIVQLARGNRPGGSRPPTLTMLRDEPFGAGADTGNLEIPAFASRIIAVPSDPTVAGVTNFYSSDIVMDLVTGNVGSGHVVSAVSGAQLASVRGLDVVGDARFARLINHGTNATRVTVYAELAA